jgi:hypothetical protein
MQLGERLVAVVLVVRKPWESAKVVTAFLVAVVVPVVLVPLIYLPTN